MRYLLIALMMFSLTLPAHSATVEQIRVSQNDQMTRLVFDLEEPVSYKTFTLENPARLVIDISGGTTNKKLKLPALDNTPVKNIRQGQLNPTTLRLVLDLHKEQEFDSRKLPPKGDYPHRLVIDLANDRPKFAASKPAIKKAPSGSQPSKVETEKVTQAPIPVAAQTVKTSPVLPRRDIVIAIDPGHGGRDPGAIGPSGTREKDVVLQISKRLETLVNNEPGMRAFMTRDRDIFLTLRQRIQRAKQNGADMFISIHADAFTNRSARGSSVYVLSERGASSEAAQILADRENAADLAGGISLEDKDDLLASVLLDLSQTASLEASLEVGNNVLSGLKRVGEVHKKQVESAAFVVLKSPDIPSVLVETAFISNPTEEAKLKNPNHQYKLAAAMMNGIRTYFQRNPITQQARPQQHIVSSGDTLSGIAQRYRVKMAELKSSNNLQDSTLHVGEVLRIP
ncbi:MAG TPA: N-acetylmuramoyl-L-alanine amidase [Methylophaga sp.]|nr:N-acetylmuramoyl-L-alanine amidase [Methylophaga sp.]